MIGFTFEQTQRGNYHMLAAPTDERALDFTVTARVDSVREFAKSQVARLEGHVTAEGLATSAPLVGTLGLRIPNERRVPYEFTFAGDDGRKYRFRGQNDVSWIALAESLTTLPASLYDDTGKEVARAVVRFDLRGDIGKLLRSFRPHLA